MNNPIIESTVVIKDDKGEVIKKYSLNIEIEKSSKLNRNYNSITETILRRIEE